MRLLLLSCFCTCFLACSPGTKQKATEITSTPGTIASSEPTPVPKDSFQTGQIIPSIPVSSAPLDSFALYLPAGYNTNRKYPLIVFFDPQGAGRLPLSLYEKLADEYGFILAGSNASKNGLTFDQTNKIANQLLLDLLNRLPVDQSKISFCGHSGGAKVAMASGGNHTLVSTIIYTGAVTQFSPNHAFTLIGFAGTHDMNYTDLVSFEWSLAENDFPHYFFEWNGAHEFPAPDVFKYAFDIIKNGKSANKPVQHISITQEKVNEEQQYKEKYIQAIQQQNLEWWKREVTMLNSKKKNEVMYERLLGFISLLCYSYLNNSLKQNDLITAEKILTLYKLADPTNKVIPDFEAALKKKKDR